MQADIRDILHERAKRMARQEEKESHEEQLDVLEFLLAHERFAIEISLVSEVLQLKTLLPLPGTPAYVAGISNVRNRIVAVVDIKQLFELPDRGLTNLNKIIVIGSEDNEFGLLVDEVIRVRTLPVSDLQTELPTLTGIREAYLRGVNGDRMTVLDGARLLADPRFIVDERNFESD